eukprot:2063248-Rhodomonas_salina.1
MAGAVAAAGAAGGAGGGGGGAGRGLPRQRHAPRASRRPPAGARAQQSQEPLERRGRACWDHGRGVCEKEHGVM